MNTFEERSHTFKIEIQSMHAVRAQMKEVLDQTHKAQSLTNQLEKKVDDCQLKISMMQRDTEKKIIEVKKKIVRMDEIIHQPNDFKACLDTAINKVNGRFAREIEKMQQ